MAVFVHLVNMPLLFTSTALVPVRQMPPWLAEIARWNPLTLVADDLRGALLLGRVDQAWQSVLPLAVIAFVLYLAAQAALSQAAQVAE